MLLGAVRALTRPGRGRPQRTDFGGLGLWRVGNLPEIPPEPQGKKDCPPRPAQFKSPRRQPGGASPGQQVCLFFAGCSHSPPAPLLAGPGQGRAMPSPVSARVQPPRSDCPPAPRAPALQRPSADPGRSRARRHLESSFSVEAILARPEPRAPASLLSFSACAAASIWSAPSASPAPVLPWACPATLLPACLGVGLHQPVPQPPALGLRLAHLCGLQGFGVTGMRCPGPASREADRAAEEWRPRQWAQDRGAVPEIENHTWVLKWENVCERGCRARGEGGPERGSGGHQGQRWGAGDSALLLRCASLMRVDSPLLPPTALWIKLGGADYSPKQLSQ